VTISVVLRLFSFTAEERYYERAERILKVFQIVMTQNPYSSAALLSRWMGAWRRRRKSSFSGRDDRP
jgi:uncharacterized protein YyaL (SSP411 family)